MNLRRSLGRFQTRFSAHFPYILGLSFVVFVLFGTSLNTFVDSGHDSLACVVRYIEYRDEIASGYWHPQVFNTVLNGGTHAFPVFYPPMGYIVALIAGLFVGNAVFAVNLSFFLSVLFSAWSGYVMGFIASRSRWGGVLAGLVLTTATYRFVNCYVRGALAESWVLVFPPLIIAGILQLANGRRAWLLVSIGVAGTILSHLVMAMWLAPLMLLGNLPIFFGKGGWRGVLQYGLAGGLGLGLTIWFVLPQQILLPGVHASDVNFMWGEWSGVVLHKVFFSQLFSISEAAWSGGSTFEPPFIDDTLSYHLGYGGVLGCLALIMMLANGCGKGAWSWKKASVCSLVGIMFLCWLFYMAVLLHTEWFYWLPTKMGYLQYPWRLLGLLAVLHAFFLAYALTLFPAFRRNKPLVIAACVLMICSVPSFLNKREYRFWIQLELPKGVSEVTAETFMQTFESKVGATSLAEYTPRDFPTRLLRANWQDFQLPKAGFVEGQGTVAATYVKPGHWDVSVQALEAGIIFIPTVYYPFWQANDSAGKPLECGSSNGFLTVKVPTGKTEIKFSRFYPEYYKLAWALSALSGLLILVFSLLPLIWKKRMIGAQAATTAATPEPDLR